MYLLNVMAREQTVYGGINDHLNDFQTERASLGKLIYSFTNLTVGLIKKMQSQILIYCGVLFLLTFVYVTFSLAM